LDDRRWRYEAWRQVAIAAACSGGRRVVLLEVGALHDCKHRANRPEAAEEAAENPEAAGSVEATAPWVTVRRESEAFLRDVLAQQRPSTTSTSSSSSSPSSSSSAGEGAAWPGVTLVRVNELYPLRDRRDPEGQARARTVSVMQPTLDALRAIDAALAALESSEAAKSGAPS
jgi:hypothetical protein